MAILGLESDDGRQEVAAKLMRINIIRVQKNRKMEFKQNMQRSYNVTLKRVVQPFLEWKSSTYYIFWVCVCNLLFAACNGHALYYIAICSLFDFTTFSHIVSYKVRVSGKVTDQGCVLTFCTNLSKIFLTLRTINRDIIINVHRPSRKAPTILVSF